MRRALFLAPIVGIAALFALLQPAHARSAGNGWYLGAGLGTSWGPALGQEGWNLESTCYPDMECFGQNPKPSIPGYRWSYDIDRDAGAAIEIFSGRSFGRGRLELALSWQRNGANQTFTGITYYDGTPVRPRPGGTVDSGSRAHVDHFNARSLLFNAYYDFPGAWGRFSPYLGAGLGVAALEMAGVHFASDYRDTTGKSYDPPLSYYNSVQDGDFGETRFAWRLYAGAEYLMQGGLLLGIRLTYAGSGDFADMGTYRIHPFFNQDPGFTNTNSFGGPRDFTLTVTLKRLLGL